MLQGLRHVQRARPASGEQAARDFDAGLLGLNEGAKPKTRAARGVAWFARGAFRVFPGVEKRFQPARKAHPAFLVDDLPARRARLQASGRCCRPDPALPGDDRVTSTIP